MKDAYVRTWPGGEHPFRLGIGEWRIIEQKCNAGIMKIMMRMLSSEAYADDILVPLRAGLIGGGMSEMEAKRVIDNALDTSSLYALAVVSADVLQHFVMEMPEDQPPGEAKAGMTSPLNPRSPMGEQDGAATTHPVQ